MCPKCKSRERERVSQKYLLCMNFDTDVVGNYPAHVWFYRNNPCFAEFPKYVKLYDGRLYYFVCSDCGYEIGRWG